MTLLGEVDATKGGLVIISEVASYRLEVVYLAVGFASNVIEVAFHNIHTCASIDSCLHCSLNYL